MGKHLLGKTLRFEWEAIHSKKSGNINVLAVHTSVTVTVVKHV